MVLKVCQLNRLWLRREEDYSIRQEDIPGILEEYDKLAVEYIKRQKEGRGFNFFHFNIDLTQGPCVAKRLSGCGSGTEYLAVTPWGGFLSMPPVCRRRRVSSRQCRYRCDKHTDPR